MANVSFFANTKLASQVDSVSIESSLLKLEDMVKTTERVLFLADSQESFEGEIDPMSASLIDFANESLTENLKLMSESMGLQHVDAALEADEDGKESMGDKAAKMGKAAINAIIELGKTLATKASEFYEWIVSKFTKENSAEELKGYMDDVDAILKGDFEEPQASKEDDVSNEADDGKKVGWHKDGSSTAFAWPERIVNKLSEFGGKSDTVDGKIAELIMQLEKDGEVIKAATSRLVSGSLTEFGTVGESISWYTTKSEVKPVSAGKDIRKMLGIIITKGFPVIVKTAKTTSTSAKSISDSTAKLKASGTITGTARRHHLQTLKLINVVNGKAKLLGDIVKYYKAKHEVALKLIKK